jgi:O-acetyl-ADP-ribose deacetylase (regulator of RNase III)
MKLEVRWNDCEIWLLHGDITTLSLDAIVNAANPALAGGGGVDGAIHRSGGPAIGEACRKIMAARGRDLATGEAVITPGGNLPARYVIHTVGPIYHRERDRAAELLAAAYRNSLALARAHHLPTLAFPCISTGAYGYPSEAAGEVALNTVRREIEQHGQIKRLVFCTFDHRDNELYQMRLREAGSRKAVQS